ncbi:hypothetical protein [Paenibacillus alvei]|nr:hypothetical protein [Paenibacillus alvei]MCY9581668.1 hypothetical protein [Paenibacillus alvei]
MNGDIRRRIWKTEDDRNPYENTIKNKKAPAAFQVEGRTGAPFYFIVDA